MKGAIDHNIYYSNQSGSKSTYNSSDPVLILNPMEHHTQINDDRSSLEEASAYRPLLEGDSESFKVNVLARLGLGYKYKWE